MISVKFQVLISLGLAYYVGLTIVYLTPFCCARFNEKRFTFATDKSLPWASFINEIRIILQISCPIIMLLFYISIIIAIKIVISYLITLLFVNSKVYNYDFQGKRLYNVEQTKAEVRILIQSFILFIVFLLTTITSSFKKPLLQLLPFISEDEMYILSTTFNYLLYMINPLLYFIFNEYEFIIFNLSHFILINQLKCYSFHQYWFIILGDFVFDFSRHLHSNPSVRQQTQRDKEEGQSMY